MIFVFGSNEQGQHGGGAARDAKNNHAWSDLGSGLWCSGQQLWHSNLCSFNEPTKLQHHSRQASVLHLVLHSVGEDEPQ